MPHSLHGTFETSANRNTVPWIPAERIVSGLREYVCKFGFQMLLQHMLVPLRHL